MENKILNINKLDKLMESYKGLGTPWDFLELTPLQFCQYIMHAKEKISVDKKQLLADLESYDSANFNANKQFLDAVFSAS